MHAYAYGRKCPQQNIPRPHNPNKQTQGHFHLQLGGDARKLLVTESLCWPPWNHLLLRIPQVHTQRSGRVGRVVAERHEGSATCTCRQPITSLQTASICFADKAPPPFPPSPAIIGRTPPPCSLLPAQCTPGHMTHHTGGCRARLTRHGALCKRLAQL